MGFSGLWTHNCTMASFKIFCTEWACNANENTVIARDSTAGSTRLESAKISWNLSAFLMHQKTYLNVAFTFAETSLLLLRHIHIQMRHLHVSLSHLIYLDYLSTVVGSKIKNLKELNNLENSLVLFVTKINSSLLFCCIFYASVSGGD